MGYEVKGNKVFATVAKLKQKEIKEIKNYIDLGFELVNVEAPKVTKEEKAAAIAANPYSKQNVEAFLKKKGNEELLKEYKARYNEQAGTNRTRKENGEIINIPDVPVFKKDGTPKAKGYANCIGWFRSMFTYDEAAKEYVATEK